MKRFSRKYLNGERAFPDKARLIIYVASESDPPRMLMFPRSNKHEGFHSHEFYVPGLTLLLIVGAALPSEIKRLYLHNHAEIPVLVCKSKTLSAYSWFKKELRSREGEFKELIAEVKGRPG
jgi:hypothetical protein